MISTYLTCALLRPGLYMEDGRPPHISEFEFWDESQSGGFAFVDNEAKAIYSLDRNKVINLEEIQVDGNNFLSETLIIPLSIRGIEPECDYHDYSRCNWVDDGESNGMLFDRANMEGEGGIAEIVKNCYEYELKRANQNPERHKLWLENKIFCCSFIALWIVHASQGWEDLYPDIDGIEFLGEGRVVHAAQKD